MRIKADLTLLIVSVIWGSAFVAQRVAGQMGSVYYFNAARYLLAALVVLPFALKASRALPSRAQTRWALLAGFLLFLGSALQQAGMVYTTAGNAGFITSLYVVLIPLVLFLFWGERPHWLSMLAVGLAGAGAFFLSTGGKFEIHVRGDFLEMVGALFWAFHVILLGKFALKFEALSFSAGQLFVCGALNLLYGAFAEPLPPLAWNWLGAVAYTAVFSLGLSYTLQVWAQRYSPPADAALLLSLESVFAVLSGWLLLGEILAPVQIFGCALIFAAVLLSQFKEWTSGKIDHQRLVEGR